MEKIFKPTEIEEFIHEHLQQKVDANEIGMMGIDLENIENFKREWEMYSTALFEGICNGILMAGGQIEGIGDNETLGDE